MKHDFDSLINEALPQSVVVNLQLCGNPRDLGLVRRIISASAASLTVPGAFLSDVKLAVTEACTNVIKHSFKFDKAKRFDMFLQVAKNILVIKITYTDPDFDPEAIPTPDFTKIQEGGLGVFIIRNVMDDVVYLKDSATGSVVLRMVKIIEPARDIGGRREN